MAVLNLQVSTGADDGYNSAFGFAASDAVTGAGEAGGAVDAFYRFGSGVSGLSGATINSAVLILRWEGGGETQTKLAADDSAAPAAPEDGDDYDGRTRTTASVPWSTTSDDFELGVPLESPDIKSVIQELADSYDPSAILILHEEVDSVHFIAATSYDASPSDAAKLDIDYTAAEPGDLNVLEGAESIPDGTTTPRDFGSIAVGGTAPQKTFTVENLGELTVTITSITVPTGYEIDASSDLDGGADTIAGGASKTLIVNLLTTNSGTFSGDIEIESDDADEATYNFAVTGVVTAPTTAAKSRPFTRAFPQAFRSAF